MNKQLTKKMIGIAASAALMASLAFSGSALAGKPEPRNPSEKDCPFAGLAPVCSAELEAAYDLIGALFLNNEEAPTFLSRNAWRDAGTLQCKTSGADIKVSQDKNYEASDLMQQAIDKIWSLYAQGKLSYAGLVQMEASFNDAKGCIDDL
jgi:hypothetical protein